ncbi:unnamed protein product [Heligmosomoides polygyrus]|uniref:Uncharacterized protein n=1 Tax=Heligmosomoides polygyrus TaxID=6339 RepID=A0A183FR68_HELPZ|nr:unnamed protein product [Heligmosomoides polygyrus]
MGDCWRSISLAADPHVYEIFKGNAPRVMIEIEIEIEMEIECRAKGFRRRALDVGQMRLDSEDVLKTSSNVRMDSEDLLKTSSNLSRDSEDLR